MLSLLLALFATAIAGGPVYVATLQGGVDPGSAAYIVDALHKAEQAGASAFVLELDTPGGLVTSARDIVQAELSSELPVIVYVGPSGARAGSAGVFLTMAAHIAVMAPGTTIGAAHPVDLFGGGSGAGSGTQEEGDEDATSGEASVMEAKVLNDVLAWSRAIAEQRGRNAEWAERAVRESDAITDREALELGVIDDISPSLEELLAEVHGRHVETGAGLVVLDTRGAPLVRVEMRPRHRLLHWLGDPNVLFALVGLGLLGLYAEFHNPGMLIPGVLGAALLIGAATGMSMVPFNVGGLLLVVFSFVAFGLEAYVGAMGVFAVSGAVALVLGGMLLFDVEGFDLRVSLWGLGVVAAVVFLVALALAILVARAHARPVHLGHEGLLGDHGVVSRGGDGRGRVQLHGEDWAATWAGDLSAGAQVRVVEVVGLTLRVEPSSPGAAPATHETVV